MVAPTGGVETHGKDKATTQIIIDQNRLLDFNNQVASFTPRMTEGKEQSGHAWFLYRPFTNEVL